MLLRSFQHISLSVDNDYKLRTKLNKAKQNKNDLKALESEQWQADSRHALILRREDIG